MFFFSLSGRLGCRNIITNWLQEAQTYVWLKHNFKPCLHFAHHVHTWEYLNRFLYISNHLELISWCFYSCVQQWEGKKLWGPSKTTHEPVRDPCHRPFMFNRFWSCRPGWLPLPKRWFQAVLMLEAVSDISDSENVTDLEVTDLEQMRCRLMRPEFHTAAPVGMSSSLFSLSPTRTAVFPATPIWFEEMTILPHNPLSLTKWLVGSPVQSQRWDVWDKGQHQVHSNLLKMCCRLATDWGEFLCVGVKQTAHPHNLGCLSSFTVGGGCWRCHVGQSRGGAGGSAKRAPCLVTVKYLTPGWVKWELQAWGTSY